jgi:arylsulfatase A
MLIAVRPFVHQHAMDCLQDDTLGVRDFNVAYWIDTDRLTVGSFLKQNEYKTAAIGKWHLGFHSTEPESKDSTRTSNNAKRNKAKSGDAGLPVGSKIIEGPITRGFDYFWGCSNARTMSGLIENDVVIESLKPIEMLPRLGAKSVQYIDQQREAAKNGKPFFLYVPLTSPHTPIVPSEEWLGKSELGSYGDFVMQTDAVVGDILTAIDQAGIANNTLVIFTADNGCSPAAKTESLEKQGHFASGPFRGYKADIWEGGHRVPFIVRWPALIPKGSASAQPICHVDLLATCADILKSKLPIDAAVDSVSILPALLGEEDKKIREAVVHHSIDGKFAIRQGKWKLIFSSGSGGWASPRDAEATTLGMPDVQLYDMLNDPSESTNVQSVHPDVVDKLTQLMEQYIENGRSTPGPKQTNDALVQRMTKKNAQPKQ